MKALIFLPGSTQRERNDVAALLSGLGMEFSFITSAEEFDNALSAGGGEAVLAIVEEQKAEGIVEPCARHGNVRLVVTMKAPLMALPRSVITSASLASLITPHGGEADFCDLFTTIHKHNQPPLFGLEYYLRMGALLFEQGVSSALSKREAIDAVSGFIHDLGRSIHTDRFAIYAQRVGGVLDELLLNAVFDANPRFQGERRDQDFILKSDESVRVRWGFDGLTFGFSVEDPFGSIKKTTILDHLTRVIKLEDVATAASGGMGLHFTYQRMHQVIFNVERKKRTEVICLMRFLPTIRDYDAQGKSVHFFISGEDAS